MPQVAITTGGRAGPSRCRVDLADEGLRIVLEAGSFEFHGQRRALERDCRRYDRLAADGWLVLRFSWEMVMGEPELVRGLVADAVDRRSPRPHRVPRTPPDRFVPHRRGRVRQRGVGETPGSRVRG